MLFLTYPMIESDNCSKLDMGIAIIPKKLDRSMNDGNTGIAIESFFLANGGIRTNARFSNGLTDIFSTKDSRF